MGVELPPDFDLDSVDPYAPTDEQLSILTGGIDIKIKFYRKNPAKLKADIAYMKGKQAEAAAAFDPEDIPQPEINRSPGDAELDAVLEGIDFVAAYQKWCGKSEIRFPIKKDSNMISCPIPDHADANPSAYFSEEGLWHCGRCQEGGDKYDLAAIHYGLAYPNGYKKDGTFPELRRKMATDFGYIVKREHGVTTVTEVETVYEVDGDDGDDDGGDDDPAGVHPDAPDDPRGGRDNGEPTTPSIRDDGSDSDHADQNAGDRVPPLRLVVPDPFLPPDPGDEGVIGVPSLSVPEALPIPVELRPTPEKIGDFDLTTAVLPWNEIIPEDTFVYEYMVQNCRFDIPHEFHWWCAMQLIAFANAYHIRVQDMPAINGNLYVVLLGQTGLGKSRSVASMRYLLETVMPWTGTKETPGTGVKVMGGVESGQALIKMMNHEYEDPASSIPGSMIAQENVVGWTMPEEFAGFVKKAMRQGSDFKERAIEFFDVGKEGSVSTTSIKAGGEISAKGPFLQVTSTTQPEAIHTYLAAEDAISGFLNRFIFVSGPSREARPARWLLSDMPDLSRATAGLRAIQAFAEAHDGLMLPWTPDGSIAWDALFMEVERIKHQVGPIAVRLDLQLKKLMMLFALNEHKTAIDADLVNRMRPVMGHLVACYQRIIGELHWRSDDDCQDNILKYIHAKNADSKTHPGRKEIVDAVKRPTQGRSRFDILRALDVLEKLDMVTVVKVERPGKTGPSRQGYKITSIGEHKVATT